MLTTTLSKSIPFENLNPEAFDGLRFGGHLKCIWVAAAAIGIGGRLVKGLRSTGDEFASLELDLYGKSFSCGAGTLRHGAGLPIGPHINGHAVGLTKSKSGTKAMLLQNGIPTPTGKAFDAAHRLEALAYSLSLGDVVCVKPEAGAKGTLVFPACRTREEIHAALDAVLASSPLVLIERNVPGDIYRFIYCYPEIAGIRISRPLQVVGDGVTTIANLASEINAERVRRNNPVHPPIEHGEDTIHHLATFGLSMESVPEKGRVVTLSPVSNFARGGGEAINIGSEMHPSYLDLAKRAFDALDGLKVGGMDLAIVDCTTPASESNCSVIEINSSPLIDAFYHPWIGEPQDTASFLIRMLQQEARDLPSSPPHAALDDHAALLEDAALASGISARAVALPGKSGSDLYLRLPVGETTFQYRHGAMRIRELDDPAGPGVHINGQATRTTTSDVRTRRALERVGIAVPRTAVFTPAQVHEAVAFAKGLDGVNVRAPDDRKDHDPEPLVEIGAIRAAIVQVARSAPRILIEEASFGHQIAFFVAGGKAVGGAWASPKQIVGDGVRSALQLIWQHHRTGLTSALEILCSQALDFGSVLAAGRLVPFSRTISLDEGRPVAAGEVHPDYWHLAERAATAIDGLKICSVRLSVADPRAPVGDKDRVLRVSSSPGIAAFCGDRRGRESSVCIAILDVLRRYQP